MWPRSFPRGQGPEVPARHCPQVGTAYGEDSRRAGGRADGGGRSESFSSVTKGKALHKQCAVLSSGSQLIFKRQSLANTPASARARQGSREVRAPRSSEPSSGSEDFQLGFVESDSKPENHTVTHNLFPHPKALLNCPSAKEPKGVWPAPRARPRGQVG